MFPTQEFANMPLRRENSFILNYVDDFKTHIGTGIMSEKIASLWHRVWGHKSEKEKRRVRSLIPMVLYGALVMYGIIYLSILNTVHRYNPGPAVKSWFGGDSPAIMAARNKEKSQQEASYKGLRKQVVGGR